MCNLYHLAPREQVERYFRVRLPPEYPELPGAAVGPFGTGWLLRRSGSSAQPLQPVQAQWGMIAPGSRSRRPASRSVLTNNARAETVAQRPTYRDAWRRGQRCLVPCAAYLEPNWETGRNIWWRMRRADGQPWALAGLWSQWTDPVTGELVPSFTVLTINCDGHPLLARLHKPVPARPADAQDKRTLVPLEPADWDEWLDGDEAAARALLRVPPVERFDLEDARRTDALLARRGSAQ